MRQTSSSHPSLSLSLSLLSFSLISARPIRSSEMSPFERVQPLLTPLVNKHHVFLSNRSNKQSVPIGMLWVCVCESVLRGKNTNVNKQICKKD
ncbi:MAG: hypothetical protein J3Q66DRAFT_353582 [Benniella sp.]|nr:MAG: hypothetical protein J3Q66DRAFT_353582 [Benniella sp.]